jgi:DNA-binding FadR family transcriptional regulator
MSLLLNTAAVGLADLLELRRALDVPAAVLAARRRTDEHLAVLRANLLDPAAHDLQTMVRAHRDFHSAVAAATCNPLFELLTRPLYQAVDGAELADSAPAGYWWRIDADHRELLRCLADKDAEAAAEVSRRHLEYVARMLGSAEAAHR